MDEEGLALVFVPVVGSVVGCRAGIETAFHAGGEKVRLESPFFGGEGVFGRR